MLINSEHVSNDERMDVINPYDNSVVDTIPMANKENVLKAIKSANDAKQEITRLSSREIFYRLNDACSDLKNQKEKIAKVITMETGKPIKGSL